MILLSNNDVLFPDSYIFFSIATSVADMAELNARGANIFFPIDIADSINFGKKFNNILPKFPPYFIVLFICTLLNFMPVDILFSIFFLNLFNCCSVKHNS